MKTTAINMNQFLPVKDSLVTYHNPTIAGVYYDFWNKVAVASDGHILCVSGSAYDSRYETDEKEGIVIDKAGNIIEGRYPCYQSAIPQMSDEWITVELDKSKIKGLIKEAREAAKKEGIKFHWILVRVAGQWFQSKYIERVIRVVDEVRVNPYKRYNSGLYGKKGKDEVLLMPMETPDTNNIEVSVVLKHNSDIVWQQPVSIIEE